MIFPFAVQRLVKRRLQALLLAAYSMLMAVFASGQITIVACGGRLLMPVSFGFCQSGTAASDSAAVEMHVSASRLNTLIKGKAKRNQTPAHRQ